MGELDPYLKGGRADYVLFGSLCDDDPRLVTVWGWSLHSCMVRARSYWRGAFVPQFGVRVKAKSSSPSRVEWTAWEEV